MPAGSCRRWSRASPTIPACRTRPAVFGLPLDRHVRRQLQLHALGRNRFGRLADRRHAHRHARLFQHHEDSAEARPRLRRPGRRERARGGGDQRRGGAPLLARRRPARPAAPPRRAPGRGPQRHEDDRRRGRRREEQPSRRDHRAGSLPAVRAASGGLADDRGPDHRRSDGVRAGRARRSRLARSRSAAGRRADDGRGDRPVDRRTPVHDAAAGDVRLRRGAARRDRRLRRAGVSRQPADAGDRRAPRDRRHARATWCASSCAKARG